MKMRYNNSEEGGKPKMNEKLKRTTNVVELQGLLMNNTLEVKKDRAGRTFVGGTLEVNTGTTDEECIVSVDIMQYELKKDGSPNELFQRARGMMEWPSVATRGMEEAINVSLNRGEFVDNAFYSQRSKRVIDSWQIRAAFVDKATRLAPRNNAFTVQGVVDSVKQMTDINSEPTGELRVDLLVVGFNERILRIPMYISNPEGVKYIEENWNPGDLVTAYGEISYEERITEIKQETAFGSGAPKRYTDIVKRLVINSGTNGKPEGEHPYERRTLLGLKNAQDRDLEERALANHSVSAKPGQSNNPYLNF